MIKKELEKRIEEINKMIEGFSEKWSLYNGNDFKDLKELNKHINIILRRK